MKDQRPYLMRAILEWIIDSGLTPYVRVAAIGATLPPNIVHDDGTTILNVSGVACTNFFLGEEGLSFNARFNRIDTYVHVPIDSILIVYPKEEPGAGMLFAQIRQRPEDHVHTAHVEEGAVTRAPDEAVTKPKPGLKLVK